MYSEPYEHWNRRLALYRWPGIWVWSIGVPIMPTQIAGLEAFVECIYWKEAQTSFPKFCTVWRYLTLVQQPGSGELVFFVPTDKQTDRQTDRRTDRQTDRQQVQPITLPCTCAWGNSLKGQLHKDTLLSRSFCWIRPPTWLHSVHEKAVPISQCAWYWPSLKGVLCSGWFYITSRSPFL